MPITQRDMEKLARALAGPLKERFAALEARIVALEQQPRGLHYEGVWRSDVVYGRGAAVTHGGSLWIAKDASVSRRPGQHQESWQLAVKRGEDGKNAGPR
jgi:hypothetical protein